MGEASNISRFTFCKSIKYNISNWNLPFCPLILFSWVLNYPKVGRCHSPYNSSTHLFGLSLVEHSSSFFSFLLPFSSSTYNNFTPIWNLGCPYVVGFCFCKPIHLPMYPYAIADTCKINFLTIHIAMCLSQIH